MGDKSHAATFDRINQQLQFVQVRGYPEIRVGYQFDLVSAFNYILNLSGLLQFAPSRRRLLTSARTLRGATKTAENLRYEIWATATSSLPCLAIDYKDIY